jgi:hypothetical protein
LASRNHDQYEAIIAEVDPWLETLTSQLLHETHQITVDGEQLIVTIGSLLQRVLASANPSGDQMGNAPTETQ